MSFRYLQAQRNNKGRAMETDGVLINRKQQPLHMLSWTGAAVIFLKSSDDFLKEKGKDVIGRWSPVCFPFNGLVEKQVKDFSDADVTRMRGILEEFRECRHTNFSDRVQELEGLFQQYLEYPPYSLYDDWDGKSHLRRMWARHIFENNQKFRL